jgi:site-specific DNA-adenine methylase
MLDVDHIRVLSFAQELFKRAANEDAYMELREEFNSQRLSAPERAAAFLYLNRHCFNGLMRYNRSNQFNVGYGSYAAPYFRRRGKGIQIPVAQMRIHDRRLQADAFSGR